MFLGWYVCVYYENVTYWWGEDKVYVADCVFVVDFKLSDKVR
jgi:hypothetical protein